MFSIKPTIKTVHCTVYKNKFKKIVLVLLFALVERFSFSRMQDFFCIFLLFNTGDIGEIRIFGFFSPKIILAQLKQFFNVEQCDYCHYLITVNTLTTTATLGFFAVVSTAATITTVPTILVLLSVVLVLQ